MTLTLTTTIMEEIIVHVMMPVLYGFESAHLVNIALANREWRQVCYEILKPRAVEMEITANQTIINKAKSWIFHRDWLRADKLRLSEATHIDVKTFLKVDLILQRLGSANKVDVKNLCPLFTRTSSFFNTTQTIIDVTTVDQTLNLLTYLRHAYSQDGMYNKDEVAICVFYLMFSYILLPDIERLIHEHPRLIMRIPLQISMAKRCFCAQLPPDYDQIYNQTLQNVDLAFQTMITR
jgi:hypothetical protein